MSSRGPQIVARSRFGPENCSTLLLAMEKKRNTSVWCFLGISGSSRWHGMGYESQKVPIFGRLIEEQEWLCWLVDSAFLDGVLTSSAFTASAPWRLMVWTSLSSRTVPFGLSFFGLEESDIHPWQETVHLGQSTHKHTHMCKLIAASAA